MDKTNHDSSLTGLRAPLGRRILNLVEALVFVAVATQIFALFGSFHFLLDLTTHFRLQSIAVLLVGGGTLLSCRRRRFGFVGVIVGILLVFSLVPYLVPASESAASASYRILVMNVLTRNSNKSGVADYILQQDPDVVVLLEVDHEWVRAIDQQLGDRWPHQLTEPRGGNFGVLLLSKQAWSEARVVDFGGHGLPSVDASFETEGTRFRIVGTHPVAPMSARNWNSRNTQLSRIAESIRDHDLRDNTILAGDLNCSPWSPFFKKMLRTSGLSNSARGHGVQPTWYALPTFLAALPIDHVCTASNIKVVGRIVGPDLESDHRAVIVDFTIDDALQRSPQPN